MTRMFSFGVCLLLVVPLSLPLQITVAQAHAQDRRASQRPTGAAVNLPWGMTHGQPDGMTTWALGRVTVATLPVSGWQPQAVVGASDGHPDDDFGGAVALSGSTALVGAGFKNRSTGAAYVLVHRGPHWSQQAMLAAEGVAVGDHFGTAVALSGDTALVGAFGTTSFRGAIYVFARRGIRWTEQAMLTADDGAAGDWFGRSVALSGDTAVVGSWYRNGDTGAAYVFVRHGTRWVQQAKLTASDGQQQDFFGSSIALYGNTVLVGAAGRNGNTGAAYVFVRHGIHWTQQAALSADDGQADGIFGASVSLSGDTALVGAAGMRNAAGAAYVFMRHGARWTQQAVLTAGSGAAHDWFGRSVVVSGRTALVGAWFTLHDAGAAYVFKTDGTRWSEQVELTAGDGSAQDWFGNAVALNRGTALVGAEFKSGATGAVYVFVQSRDQ